MKQGNEYSWCGYHMKVERIGVSGQYFGVGRAAGRPLYRLDKLGGAATQELMQERLDAWARRQGCRPINTAKASEARKQMALAGF